MIILHNKLIKQFKFSFSFVGGAMDGQYFNLKVPEHLMDKMNVPQNDREWYTFVWDPAHQIELSVNDAKNSKRIKGNPHQWIGETEGTITNVNRDVSYGKGYENIINNADSTRVPKSFSDTRWATYAAETIDNFLYNYEPLYDKLNAEKSDKLDKINNSDFILKANGLADFYSSVGEASRAIQDPEMYAWQVDNKIEQHSQNMIAMAQSFRESDNSDHYGNTITRFKKAAEELKTSNTFHGKPILDKRHVPTSTRKKSMAEETQSMSTEDRETKVGEKLGQFVEKYHENFHRRLNDTECKTLSKERELFCTELINLNEPEYIPPVFKDHCDLAKRVNCIDAEVNQEDLDKQYLKFKGKILETTGGEGITDAQERKLYTRLIKEPNGFKDCKEIGKLVATATTRTRCEAVVEGMASVAGKHSKHRNSLKPENLSKEV